MNCFDGRGLAAGRVGSRFVAVEEVLLHQLSRRTVLEPIATNSVFGALLFADIGHKLDALAARHEQHELQSLTLARVDQAYLRPARMVDAATDSVSVMRIFQRQRSSNVLVRGLAGGLGIFTTTSLQRAILDGRPLDALVVGEFATTARCWVCWKGSICSASCRTVRCCHGDRARGGAGARAVGQRRPGAAAGRVAALCGGALAAQREGAGARATQRNATAASSMPASWWHSRAMLRSGALAAGCATCPGCIALKAGWRS